jgi:nitrite reductase (NO-forming)
MKLQALTLTFCKRLSRLGLGPQAARKAVTLLTVIALAAAFAACGGGGDSTSTDAQATPGEGSNGSVAAAKAKAKTFEKEHPGSAEFGSPPLEFEADPSGKLAYTADEVTAKEGNVTIEFTNPQSTPHNVKIEAFPSHGSVTTDTVKNGFSAITVTLNAKEKFIYYCTIPGHRKAGMEGIIRVKPR